MQVCLLQEGGGEGKKPQCLSRRKWLNALQHISTVEYLKKNKLEWQVQISTTYHVNQEGGLVFIYICI